MLKCHLSTFVLHVVILAYLDFKLYFAFNCNGMLETFVAVREYVFSLFCAVLEIFLCELRKLVTNLKKICEGDVSFAVSFELHDLG